MKKKLTLWADFYKGSVFSTLLLIVVTAIALLSVIYAIGVFGFLNYTKTLYEGAGLQNSVYYMLNTEFQISVLDNPQGIEEIYKTASSFPGVERVVRSSNGKAMYNGTPCSTSIYDDFMVKAFPLRLSSGSWFQTLPQSDGLPQVVVGGDLYSNVKVGDTISLNLQTLRIESDEEQQITAKVVGKIRSPSYIVSFNRSGSNIETNALMQIADMVIFQHDDSLPTLLKKDIAQLTAANAFVVFSPNATQEEKETVFTYLRQNGSYLTFDQIMNHTNAYIADKIKTKGMFPLFLLFVATMSLISISMLLVYKKLETHSIYFLCGCSRNKSFLQMFAGIFGISAVAGFLNILIILFYPYLYTHGILNLGDVVIDETSILFVLLYMVIVSLLSTILPYLIFRKTSPIAFYRRKES